MYYWSTTFCSGRKIHTTHVFPVLPEGISNEMPRQRVSKDPKKVSFLCVISPRLQKKGEEGDRGKLNRVSIFCIFCSLHSLSMGPIHYRISWETRGLLPSDPSGDHTKEVIGGGLLSSGTSSSLTALCNGSFLVNIWISILLGLLTLTAWRSRGSMPRVVVSIISRLWKYSPKTSWRRTKNTVIKIPRFLLS